MRRGYLVTSLALVLAGLAIVIMRAEVVSGAPLRQNQPDGSTIVSPQNVNGTWGPGTITATSNVVINAGVVITIAPNTTIRVVGNRLFTVNGNLHSDGPITFTSPSAVPGAWQGILYAPGSTGYLNAATVQYAQQAVTLNTVNPITISNSALRYNLEQTGGNTAAFGAGLTIQLGDHLILNTQIYSNTASSQNGNSLGAGLYIMAGTPTIQGCQIYQNYAIPRGSGSAFGGGVYIQAGNPLITDTLVYTNAVQASGAVYGGGIAIVAGSPQIINSRIYQNTAATTSNANGAGGGIGMVGGAALIENSYVLTNTLSGGTGTSNSNVKSGGGIGIYGNTSSIIRGCWIAANRVALTAGNAGGGGIGLGLNGTATRVERSVIYANYIAAPYWCEGSGIDAWDTTNSVTIVNNLIVSNTTGTCGNGSPYGGGMNLNANANGVYVINNTIVGNQATNGRGGGVYLQGGAPVVSNNIIANNTASSGGGVYRDVGTVDYNDIFGNAPQNTVGTVGSNNAYLDPLFLGAGDLAQWYHLRQGSPAIDDGTNAGAGLPTDDYDGDARPLGAIWDMGFDEVNPFTYTKSVNQAVVYAGEALTYTIVITNPDPRSTFVSGRITDVLPLTTTFRSGPTCSRGSCGYNSGSQTITWTGDIPTNGGVLSLSYSVLVNPGASVGTAITNSAFITVSAKGGWTNIVTTSVVANADLVATKSDSPDPVQAGTTLTYTLFYANNGPSNARNVTLTDTLPTSVTLGGVVSEVPPIAGPTQTGRLLTWYTPTLAAGASGTLVYTVTVNASASGVITNSVVITSSTPDPSPGNNRDDEPTTIINANLTLSKSDSPDPVMAGASLTWTLAYTNVGPSNAQNVTLTDTLPASVIFGGVVSAVPPIAGPTQVGQQLTWSMPTLAAGTARFFRVASLQQGATPDD